MTRFLAALLALASLAGVACSSAEGKTQQAVAASTPSPVTGFMLPSKILGLTVEEEDISKEREQVSESYLDSLSLFGFRERTTLRGALQVGRFNDLARPEDAAFRQRVASQFGSTVPQELRLGDTLIYMSPGQLQYSFLWFSDRWMYVLTVRRDYPFARTLLRRLVEMSIA